MLITKFVSHGVPVEIHLEDEGDYTEEEANRLITEFLGILFFGKKFRDAMDYYRWFESHKG